MKGYTNQDEWMLKEKSKKLRLVPVQKDGYRIVPSYRYQDNTHFRLRLFDCVYQYNVIMSSMYKSLSDK